MLPRLPTRPPRLLRRTFLLRVESRPNLYAYLHSSVRKPYQVPQGSTHFFVHSLAVLRNAPLSFFNCCIQSQFRPASPLSILATYRCYLRLKRVVRARIIYLFLDDGKYYSNRHTSTQCIRPVFLTCGECDGRLPLVSYLATCS